MPGQLSKDDAHRQRRRQQSQRRSVIEALIGHMKSDGLMGRNWLKGSAGDAMHVVLCAAGQNLRRILRAIAAFFIGRYLMGLNKHPEADVRPQRIQVWFAWLWDVAAMPQLAGTRRFGIIALTLTETDPPLLTKTDPLTSRGIVFC